MTIMAGRVTGAAICEALGIELRGVVRVELVAELDNVTTVRVDRHVYDEQLGRLVKLVREYSIGAVRRHQPSRVRGYDPYNHQGSAADGRAA